MGNSSSNFGGLKIELDESIVSSGDKAKGKIHIFIKESLPSCQLTLQFIGKEHTFWEVKDNNTYNLYSGNVLLADLNHVLYSWPDGLHPSSITIPFEFNIPPNLPGSYKSNSSGYSGAKIYYSLKVFMKNENKTFLEDEQSVLVFSNENYEISDPIPISLNLVSCCCIKKNIITLNLKWINNTFTHGQNIDCILEVDNKLGLCNINYITAKVFCSTVIYDNYRRSSMITEYLIDADYYIRIKKGEVLNETNGGRFSFDLNKAPLPWNPFDLHTCNSTLIKADFYVLFKLTTDTFLLCNQNEPSIHSKFYVKPNKLFYFPASVNAEIVPEGWDPELYEAVSIEPGVEAKGDEDVSGQVLGKQ